VTNNKKERKQIVMGLTTIPRRVGRLEYSAARLPFTVVEKRVLGRYLDEHQFLRIRFERFLGSLDGLAGWLLADADISRRGRALRRRTEFLAKANDLDRKAKERKDQAEWKLRSEQGNAHQARENVQRELDEKIAAAYDADREQKRRAGRAADASADAEKAQARRDAQIRAAEAEDAKRAEHERISADEEEVTTAAEQRLSDAADRRRLVKYRREEADHLGQIAADERDDGRTT